MLQTLDLISFQVYFVWRKAYSAQFIGIATPFDELHTSTIKIHLTHGSVNSKEIAHLALLNKISFLSLSLSLLAHSGVMTLSLSLSLSLF